MTFKSAAAVAAACVCLSGCAAVFDGTSQEIMVSTNPAGATCTIERKGTTIATITSTPAAARIKKTKDDITIKCNKGGYEETTYLNHSGVAGAAISPRDCGSTRITCCWRRASTFLRARAASTPIPPSTATRWSFPGSGAARRERFISSGRSFPRGETMRSWSRASVSRSGGASSLGG